MDNVLFSLHIFTILLNEYYLLRLIVLKLNILNLFGKNFSLLVTVNYYWVIKDLFPCKNTDYVKIVKVSIETNLKKSYQFVCLGRRTRRSYLKPDGT